MFEYINEKAPAFFTMIAVIEATVEVASLVSLVAVTWMLFAPAVILVVPMALYGVIKRLEKLINVVKIIYSIDNTGEAQAA